MNEIWDGPKHVMEITSVVFFVDLVVCKLSFTMCVSLGAKLLCLVYVSVERLQSVKEQYPNVRKQVQHALHLTTRGGGA